MQQREQHDRMINQLVDDSGNNGGGSSYMANARVSPSRVSRSRFSPDNAVGRGTLVSVLGGGRASRQSPYGGSRATFSRAGGQSRASVRDPNQVAGDVDNINIHSPDAIERERHFAQVRQELQRQFESIDADHNGYVDRQELRDYMLRLTEQARGSSAMNQEEQQNLEERFEAVISDLFERMDKGDDQKIDITEFIDTFHLEYTQLNEEIEELELRVKDQEQRAGQIEQRLAEMKRQEKPSVHMHPVFTDQYIMKGSILSVHVIDARDLRPVFMNSANAQVRLIIEGNRSNTKENPQTNNPVWNEVSAFDIEKAQDTLKVEVLDCEADDGSKGIGQRQRQVVGSVEISLNQLSYEQQRWMEESPGLLERMQAGEFDGQMLNSDPPEIDQMKKDELYDLLPQGSGQIRISLQWIYSKVKLLSDVLLHLRFQIHRDKNDKLIKEDLLADMQEPFGGFLKATVANTALNMGDRDLVDTFTKFGVPTEEEKKMAKDVEKYIKQRGMPNVKWARATFVMTIIFTIITCLVHFYKADFVNLTVCTVAIHMLSNPKDVKPTQFRYLVAGTILSFAYDILWLLMRGSDMAGDDEEDGGVEQSIRKFSLFMTIIAMVFKAIMTFVYWMASMRFEDIIDERSALL